MTYVRDRAAINLQKLEQGSQTVQRFLYFLQTRCKKLGPFYINTRKLYFLSADSFVFLLPPTEARGNVSQVVSKSKLRRSLTS